MEEKTAVTRIRRRDVGFLESPTIHRVLKGLLCLVIVLVVLTLIQCSIEKPVAPTFTTNLTVPLVNRTYSIREIIDKIDQPGLSLDSAGDVFFSVEKELDTVKIGDKLNLSDLSKEFTGTLGEVSLTPVVPAPLNISLGDYISLGPGDLPPASFDIQKDFQPFENFNWAQISSGGIDIIIANDFGVDLDTAILQVYDIGYSNLVATAPILPPGISKGSVDTAWIDLSGKTISNHLQLNLHCHTQGGSLIAQAENTMTTALECPGGLIVAAAEAMIPAMEKSFSSSESLSESNTIFSAEVSSGTARFMIQNKTSLQGSLQIDLPDFREDGSAYSLTRTINPNSTDSININLAGFIFQPLDQTRPQAIEFQTTSYLNSTGPALVTVHQSDSILVNVSLSDLKFQSLTGIIDSTEASFDSIKAAFELPKGFDSLQLVDAELALEIENGINFSGDLNLNIVGNQGKILNLQGAIASGNHESPVISVINNSSLADFLNPVPKEITVGGSIVFGDGLTSGTISIDDFIASKVRISSPLKAVIGRSVFEGDISSEKISQDDIDKITRHLIRADFNSTITNHLPIGVSVEIYFSGDSSTIYSNPELTIGPVDVNPGIFGIDGEVISPTESENIISIDSNDIKILENPVLYSGQIITLAGSNGQVIKITGNDYVSARGFIQVQYKFDGDF